VTPALSLKEGMLCKKTLGKSNTKYLRQKAERNKKQETRGGLAHQQSPSMPSSAPNCEQFLALLPECKISSRLSSTQSPSLAFALSKF